MIYFLVFYNSLNIEYNKAQNFYNNLSLYINQNNSLLNNINNDVDLLGIYDIINDSEKFNNDLLLREDSKIFLITLGGDGTLFNSLSLIKKSLVKKKIKSNLNIFVFPINFGSKGFYCFYDKNYINNIDNFVNKILIDYNNSIYLKGFFMKLTIRDIEEYFVGDIVIKSKTNYKPVKLRYYINDSDIYIQELSDGLLVFSKFGTTGYFLALNGIFIDLDIDNLIGITFIAPHSIKYKPQIFKDKKIYIENLDNNELIIIKDGQILNNLIFNPKETIKIELDNSYFYLMGKNNIFDKWYKTFYI
jgi:NAD kinase